MHPERWHQIRATFEEAMDMPPPERAQFLDRVCDGDTELRCEIADLLAADAPEAESASEEDVTSEWLKSRIEAMLCGTTIANCRILRVLGSGGMGTVYEAEQNHPKRTVALKVLRPGIDEGQRLKSFQSEADLLASLRHAHVAQVYSAGVHEVEIGGRTCRLPFLVMEPVERALDLVNFAERNRLDTRSRIGLFLNVCDALYQAHRRGLVHRDVKPSNLLVDGHGKVKVIDFGIAGMADDDCPAPAGTLRYMSPEQESGEPGIDIRADVYSLGVVLRELLPEADTELGWIQSKATAPDPEQRYGHAGDLAADLRRRLAEEPVVAAPSSRIYKARKLVVRRRVFVAAAAIALIGAVVGVAGLAAGYVEAARQHETAVARAAEAEAVVEFIQKMLISAQPWHDGSDATVGEFLDRSAKSIDEEFADAPGVAAVLHATIGWSLYGIGRLSDAERSLRRAVEVMEDLPTTRPRQLLIAKHRLAAVVSDLGDPAQAEALLADSVDQAVKLFGPDDDVTLSALDLRAICLSAIGRADESVVILRKVIEISDRRFGTNSKSSIAHRNNLLSVLARLGQHSEALELSAQSEGTMRQLFGVDHPDTLVTMQNRAALLYLTDEFEASEQLTREVLTHRDDLLGEQHPHTILSRYWLSAALNGLQRHSEALAALRPLLFLTRRVLGEAHNHTLKVELEFAKALAALGQEAEATKTARRIEELTADRADAAAVRVRGEATRIRLKAEEK